MAHLPHLIEDLGLILMAAAIVTLLFKKFKQPVVLGYLIAGFIVGPNFTLLPSVKDTANVSIWAEIGVIFMLFGLGLEFSFKKLMKVGKSASITGLFEIVAMLAIGYLAGQVLGWSKMDSIFLGGILSISSTTIIVRAFDELGIKGKSFVPLVFGVLIVEDLLAILLLVLLSSVAVTQSLSGSDLAFSMLRLIFFLVLWFLLGIYLLPILLQKFKNFLSDETMLIVSIGLCLMMVIIASYTGFSPALGAFVMGSILAETSKGKQIEHLIVPVKDLFSAVFFVSVGMLIDPKVLMQNFEVVFFITAITIVGKVISTVLGSLVAGGNVKNSVQAGMSLAQIGEFSFIIATLGMTLGVTSHFLYPIAVTVSAITTFTTPYLIKFSGPLAEAIEGRLPLLVRNSLTKYEIAMSTTGENSFFLLLWRAYGVKLFLNSVIILGITLAVSRFTLPLLEEKDVGEALKYLVYGSTLVLTTPFFWTIFFGKASTVHYSTEIQEQLKKFQFGVTIIRFVIGITLAVITVSSFTSLLTGSGILLIAMTTPWAFLLSHFSEPIYKKIEDRFLSNLTQNERNEIQNRNNVELAPWNASLVELTLSPYSPLVAKTLNESRIKETFGVTVTMIERADTRILAPRSSVILLPGDVLFLIGTEDQLLAAQEIIERKSTGQLPAIEGHFGLASIILKQQDPFVDKPIRYCGLRESVNGLIVGIERNGERYLSPDSSMELKANDRIWLVGDRKLIKELRTV